MNRNEETTSQNSLSHQLDYLLHQFEEEYQHYKALLETETSDIKVGEMSFPQITLLKTDRLLRQSGIQIIPFSKELEPFILEALKREVHHVFADQATKKIIDQFKQIASNKDKEGTALLFSNDYSQLVLSDKGKIMRLTWRLSVGALPKERKEDSLKGVSRIFGLYYGLFDVNAENFTEEKFKYCLSGLADLLLLEKLQHEEIQYVFKKCQSSRLQWNFLSQIGVFQVVKDNKVIDFGIGMYKYPNQLLTLAKYFENKEIISGKVFFKRLDKDHQKAFQFNMEHLDPSQFDISGSQLGDKFQGNEKIVKIRLINQPKRYQCSFFVNSHILQSLSKGLAFGLKKTNMIAKIVPTFYQILNKDSLQQFDSALLFTEPGWNEEEKHSQFFFGLYDNLDNKKGQYLKLFANQAIQVQQRPIFHTEAFMLGSNRYQPKAPGDRFPFNSIGILKSDDGPGTAQLLYNSKDECCPFLITCAHNFLNLNSDNFTYKKSFNKYSFELPIKDSNNQHEYVMTSKITPQISMEKEFIRQVFIHPQYIRNFNQIKKRNKGPQVEPQKKLVEFPSGNQLTSEQSSTHELDVMQLYDIAIVKLKKPIPIQHGFQLRENEKPFKDIDKARIQLTGFPADPSHNTLVGRMYSETSQIYADVKVSKENLLLSHKFSTLVGNSGSPIYEWISEDKCYLFGIHHGTSLPLPQENMSQKQARDSKRIMNLANYIYAEKIQEWWRGIKGIGTVYEKKKE